MEKEKGKTHPFAGHLRPTEEVLWLSTKAQPTPLRRFAKPVTFILFFAGLVGYGVSDTLGVADVQRIKAIALAIGLTILIGALVLVPMGIYAWFKSSPLRLAEQAYAITNERLLYRNEKNVSTIPLENLPSVSLFLGDGTKGTFSFGALFPMWPDVEDAIQIKHLIDDAQKKRLQQI